MQTQHKKGAVDLQELAVAVVILGIVVAIGATIIITMRNNTVTNLPSYLVRNETVTVTGTSTSGGVALSSIWVRSIDLVTNSTGGQVYTSGNYSSSINSGTGVATFFNATSKLPATWNVSYTVYNVSDPQYAIPNNAAIGLSQYGNWFPILVIVGIAAVVIALILSAFSNRATGGEGNPLY